jgi:hypothetical protein
LGIGAVPGAILGAIGGGLTGAVAGGSGGAAIGGAIAPAICGNGESVQGGTFDGLGTTSDVTGSDEAAPGSFSGQGGAPSTSGESQVIGGETTHGSESGQGGASSTSDQSSQIGGQSTSDESQQSGGGGGDDKGGSIPNPDDPKGFPGPDDPHGAALPTLTYAVGGVASLLTPANSSQLLLSAWPQLESSGQLAHAGFLGAIPAAAKNAGESAAEKASQETVAEGTRSAAIGTVRLGMAASAAAQ